MICERCGQTYSIDYRKDATRRKTPSRFCSRSCANSKVFTAETRELKSRKNLEFYARRREADHSHYYTCEVCGTEFYSKQCNYSKPKTCSASCRSTLQSIKRTAYLAEHGSWVSERRAFSYKNVSIECDSALEEAAVVYLVDVQDAVAVERYRNLINYHESGLHKVFNPDFWVTFKDGSCGIVEVKMRWSVTSSHSYNRPIPLKKAALQAFCKDKGLQFIWLDFDYDSRFQPIYEKHLKAGTGRRYFVKKAGVSPHSDKV